VSRKRGAEVGCCFLGDLGWPNELEVVDLLCVEGAKVLSMSAVLPENEEVVGNPRESSRELKS